MAHFLVLGAAGQVGSELVRLLPEGDKIALTREQLDVTHFEQLHATITSVHPKVVFNCTGFVKVDEAEENWEEAWRVNALAVLVMAKACAEVDATLVHLSTDYVFDGRKKTPYTELDVPHPLNFYGVTKLAGEFFARAYSPRCFVVRSAGLYGRRGSRAKGGSFVDRILAKAMSGEPLRVVADQVTSPTYAGDLAAHLVVLAETEHFGLYHIVNRGFCSWYEFASAIISLAGLSAPLIPISSNELGLKARRPAFSALASVRLLSAGLPPLRFWREALEAFLRECHER